MNYKRLFLLSVGLNLLFGALLLTRSPRPSAPSQFVSEVSAGRSGANSNEVTGSKARLRRASTLATDSRKIVDWRAVESPDYREYVANLRTIGCPEATIRDIISADLKQLYKSRKWQIVGPISGTVRYWETNFSLTIGEPAFNQLREQENEYKTVSKDLLGSEVAPSDSFLTDVNHTETRLLFEFGPLPDSKLDQLKEWLLSKENRERKLNPLGASLSDEFVKIQAAAEEGLADILTPDELEQHQLRTSPLASDLREQLSGFHPSEEEFVQIFRLRKEFQEPFSKGQPVSEQAQQDLQSQLSALLGPRRYADYGRSLAKQAATK